MIHAWMLSYLPSVSDDYWPQNSLLHASYGFWSYGLLVFLWTVVFFGAKYCQKVTLYSANIIFVTNSLFFEKKLVWKGQKITFLGRVWSHFCLLATILKIPWSNVVSWVEVCLGMLATVVPSVNWKKKHSNHKCLDVDNSLIFFIIAKSICHLIWMESLPLMIESLGWVVGNKM